MQNVYRPVLTFFIKQRVLAIVLVVILLITGGIGMTQLGSEFTPRLQEGNIVMRLTLAPSISLEESKRITMIVERRLMEIQEVREVVSRIGRGSWCAF